FEQARRAKEEALANTTTIIHQNGKEGLSKEVAARQLESAMHQGNSKVKLKGRDRQGNKLEGK
ncbi:MAG: hypothetical protein AAF902_20715, partial [Chloroflexota bacterium]